MPEERATVSAKGHLFTDPVFIGSGFVMPRTFTFEADLAEGLRVEGEVEIENERAIPKRLTIEAPDGISSTTLRRIPVRDVVATGCLNVLLKARPEPREDPTGLLVTAVDKDDHDAVRELIQRLVGYKPEVRA